MGKTNMEKFVIIRSNMSGVFAGTLVEQDNVNRCVKLRDAIRCWYWHGAFTLSQLAMEGVKNPDKCKFGMPVDEIVIFDVIEIITATQAAKENICEVKSCKI
jgi:hypothetical protein